MPMHAHVASLRVRRTLSPIKHDVSGGVFTVVYFVCLPQREIDKVPIASVRSSAIKEFEVLRNCTCWCVNLCKENTPTNN